LRAGGLKGDTLRRLDVVERLPSGRAAWLRVDGFTPDRISANDFRTLVGRTLGWQRIRSTMFDVTRLAAGYRFSGRGAGHGVGLCVLGSTRLASRGESVDAILAAYFPGLEATALRPARQSLEIFLPEQDEQERAIVERITRTALERLSTRLRLDPPATLSLRFHPTVESYQRATGQPWFTAGATEAVNTHFIPLHALRRRGLLERTIGHELVHAFTADALRGRPRWLIEGAAAYYALAAPPEGRAAPVEAACPSDAEFRRPASAAALEQVYARSLACFRRTLAAGGNWLEGRAPR
jgi:stage II sporulation protein D